ncbi:MAG: ATP-dependent DNA helicase [Lachnospiraceae bacterium]|nr:ATP-dependent DNA helicase [Lachnospiraceae bacterium]
MDKEGNIRISVRHLVEFLLRSGDIDERSAALPDPEVMLMGGRVHREIQKGMGEEYKPEVPLSMSFPCDDFTITLEGRADGVITGEDGVTVDEIKGILRPLSLMEEPQDVHLAQAKCYACMLAMQLDLKQVTVRLTYVQMDKREKKTPRAAKENIRYFESLHTRQELETWFFALLDEYRKWARFWHNWKIRRNESIHQTEFPFPYREGQRSLVVSVYRSIAREKELFIQAPTGVGKTLAVLFPAVKAVGEGLSERIFYLTARTIARTVALEGFSQLKEAGLEAKVVVLTAKEKICLLDKPQCTPETCPYAKGHFDRVNDVLYRLITQEDTFTRERIEQAAREEMLCPFELSLDLSLWMDGIICDYNYVFHPRAYLRRFFGESRGKENLFLIDEAHNLVDRGRDMYSAQLVREDFLSVRRLMKEEEKSVSFGAGKNADLLRARKKVTSSLEKCSRELLRLKRECTGEEGAPCRELDGVDTLPVALLNFTAAASEYFDIASSLHVSEQSAGEGLRDLYFQASFFLDICDRLDSCYLIYDEIEPGGRFTLNLQCMDPSVNLQECLDRARSSVFFSATLLPVQYYKQLLTTRTDVYAVYAKSCFDQEKLQVFIASDISSRYRDRDASLYGRIAAYILETVQARSGNYMVFFPSYRMLEETEAVLAGQLLPGTELLCQRSGMREAEREAFLEAFSARQEGSLIGLCVMGSIFGEGIDLQQDRLIGAIVVGTGLPQVCSERELLRAYSQRRWGTGFLYAYLYPGMNKVLQAAGRVIRTETDCGIVTLLDERFLGEDYDTLFPREWSSRQVCSLTDYARKMKDFWEKQK